MVLDGVLDGVLNGILVLVIYLYFTGLLYLRDTPQSDAEFDALDMPFSSPGAAGQEVPLSSTYSRITLSNRDLYVRSALEYRLHEFDVQVHSTPVLFRKDKSS